jgi:hypothetical protein
MASTWWGADFGVGNGQPNSPEVPLYVRCVR